MEAQTRNFSTKRAVRGVIWTYASYYSGKLLVFVSTIVLARLLTQDDFGVAGYALVIINSLNVLSNLGVGQALIFHREDPRAADTAFWLGLLISTTLFAITWFGAPLVGSFFGDTRAIPVTRALAFTFPIYSLGYVQDMLLQKDLSFGRKFIPDVTKSLGKGIFAIIFAVLGYGAWALIYSQLIGEIVSVAVYWIVVSWRPSFTFIQSLARKLLGFGLNVVAVNSMSVLLNNADVLLVGRFMGAAMLGVYTLAFRIPDMLVMQFNALISKVIFPFYARMKEDVETLGQGFLYTTKYITLITMPLGIGAALVSRPMVLSLFGEKWLEAIPVMQALAVYTVIVSLAYNAGDIYKAQGKPEILTRLTIIEALLLLPALYVSIVIWGNIIAVSWARVMVAVVIGLIEFVIASRMLKTSLETIFMTIWPAVSAVGLMSIAVGILLYQVQGITSIFQLISGIFLGALVYVGSLWIFHRELLLDGIGIFKKALVR